MSPVPSLSILLARVESDTFNSSWHERQPNVTSEEMLTWLQTTENAHDPLWGCLVSAVASHPLVPMRWIEKMLNGRMSDLSALDRRLFLAALAGNTHLPPDVLLSTWNSSGVEDRSLVTRQLAFNPSISGSLLSNVVSYESEAVLTGREDDVLACVALLRNIHLDDADAVVLVSSLVSFAESYAQDSDPSMLWHMHATLSGIYASARGRAWFTPESASWVITTAAVGLG